MAPPDLRLATLVMSAHRPGRFTRSISGDAPFTLSADGLVLVRIGPTDPTAVLELPIGRHGLRVTEDFSGADAHACHRGLRPPFSFADRDATVGEMVVVVAAASDNVRGAAGGAPVGRSRSARWLSRDLILDPGAVGFVTCRRRVGNHRAWYAFYPTVAQPTGWGDLPRIHLTTG